MKSRSLQPISLAVVLLAGCQTPTEVLLEVSTNAQCNDLRGTTITVGRLEELETRPPSARTESCAAGTGRIGSLGILPRDGTKDEFAIRVVTGFYKSPEQCVKDGYVGGCIVARRVLSFVPKQILTLPVLMESNCVDVPCGVTETCRNGRCVPARLDDPEHCTDPAGCHMGTPVGGAGSAAGGMQSVGGSGESAGVGGNSPITGGTQGFGGGSDGGEAGATMANGGDRSGSTGGSNAGTDSGGATTFGGASGGSIDASGAGGTLGGSGAGGESSVAGIGGDSGGTMGGAAGRGGDSGGTMGGAAGFGGSTGGTMGGGGGASCSAPSSKDCNGTCANLDSDLKNCGACGVVCADLHGAVSCALGECSSACQPGWDDCAGNYVCETQIAGSDLDNCGACGAPCNPAHAIPTCSKGVCQIASCVYGYANCDGSQSTGCETQLMDVTDGLRGFWSLDETTGLVAADGSSDRHDGALINMTGGEWTRGPVSGSLQFDGLDDYVAIGNVGARIKTLSFWMRSDFVPRPLTDTGERVPSASGSPHHDWANASKAYANDGSYASATFVVLGSAAQDWSAFDFKVPAGATIQGIEAKIETKVSSVSLGSYAVSLSWDGGNSYTSSKTIPSGLLGNAEQVHSLGGSADTWGHSWSADEINNGFRIRADFTAIGLGTVYVDYITVKVTYLPYVGQKVIDVDGAAQIELTGSQLSATNFPGTTAYYIDGTSGRTLPTGWHHVVISNDTGVDATSLELGKVAGGYFVGALDEIRAYDRVLAAKEIGFLAGDAACP